MHYEDAKQNCPADAGALSVCEIYTMYIPDTMRYDIASTTIQQRCTACIKVHMPEGVTSYSYDCLNDMPERLHRCAVLICSPACGTSAHLDPDSGRNHR